MTNFHSISSYPTLTNTLFGAVKLTKNTELTLTNINIQDMELDLMDMEIIHILLEVLEEI